MLSKNKNLYIITFAFFLAFVSVYVSAQEGTITLPPSSEFLPPDPTPGQRTSPEAFPGEPSGVTPPLSLPAGGTEQGPVAPAAQPPAVQAPSAPSVGRDYTLAEPLPVPGNQPITSTNFIAYLQWLFPFMLSVAGILAVVMIIVGGLEYMTSAGNTDAISRAKDRITNAILGLLLAAASWLILYTINPDLIRFRLNITGLRALPQEQLPQIPTREEIAARNIQNCPNISAPCAGNRDCNSDRLYCNTRAGLYGVGQCQERTQGICSLP